jgi:crotonobetainyl-CoA:carnitine CoA-transferase CaiB-like acyl-CoA transferase
MTIRPFQDLLVADISGSVATSYAAKLFADYGARVVNVEPPQGFRSRNLEPTLQNGSSALFGYLNAGKESVTAEQPLQHPAVLSANLVIVEPSESSIDLLEEIPGNVCAISWFGLDGPYADFNGTDAVIHALTGLMKGIGEIQGPPVIPQGYQAQMIGAVSAFNGAAAFLMAQSPDGHRRFCLDASILEANMCLTDLGPINAFNGNPLPFRMGINKFPPTYPLGIWPCRDGWLGVTCLSPAQWQAFCCLLGLDDLADIPLFQSSSARLEAADVIEPRILDALSRESAEDLFYRGQAMRIPLARVPTMGELFSVDQFAERRAFCEFESDGEVFQAPSIPYRLTSTPPDYGGVVSALGTDNDKWRGHSVGNESAIKPEADALPLEGTIIIDLGMGWAAPLAARNLADLGATVIKIESCTRFDWWRSWEATEEWIEDDGAEKSLQYVYVNRNKLDVTLDLETQSGRNLLLRLVALADALIENYSGEVLPKLKLDYKHLVEVNPELVMVSMPPFGSAGPWAGFRAYGSTVEQSSGLPHLNGAEDQPPTMQHVAYGDSIAGLNGTAAMLTALYHKKRTGRGQFVDLSQVECLFPHAAPGILHQSVNGEPLKREGNRRDDVLQGVFPCEGDDRWVLIQVFEDEEWEKLCAAVPGLRDLIHLRVEDRAAEYKRIEKILGDWTGKLDSAGLMFDLQQAGVTAAGLHDAESLLHEAHLKARGYLQMLDREFVGRQPHPSPPWRLSTEPLPVRSAAPTLGQHNQAVLGDMLGLSSAELDELTESGVIGTRPRIKTQP